MSRVAVGFALLLGGIMGCTSILGIHERKLRPAAGGAGEGGDSGEGGGESGSGGTCINCSTGGSASGGQSGGGGMCTTPDCGSTGGASGSVATCVANYGSTSSCATCLCQSCDANSECAQPGVHCDALERCIQQSECKDPASCKMGATCADVVAASGASDALIMQLIVCENTCPECTPTASSVDPRDVCAAATGTAGCSPCACSQCDPTLASTCGQQGTCGAYASCILTSGCVGESACIAQCGSGTSDPVTFKSIYECLGGSCTQCEAALTLGAPGSGGATGGGGASGAGGVSSAGGAGGGSGVEVCNFVDDDGNGQVDEGFSWSIGNWVPLVPLAAGTAQQLRAIEGPVPGQIALVWIDGSSSPPQTAAFALINDDGASVGTVRQSVAITTQTGLITGIAVAASTTDVVSFSTSNDPSKPAQFLDIDTATKTLKTTAPTTAPGSVMGLAPYSAGSTSWAALFTDGNSALLRSYDANGQPSTAVTYNFPLGLDGRGACGGEAGVVFCAAETSSYGVLGVLLGQGEPTQAEQFPQLAGGLAADRSVAGGTYQGQPSAVVFTGTASSGKSTLSAAIAPGPVISATFPTQLPAGSIAISVVPLGPDFITLSVLLTGEANISRYDGNLQAYPLTTLFPVVTPRMTMAFGNGRLLVFRGGGGADGSIDVAPVICSP